MNFILKKPLLSIITLLFIQVTLAQTNNTLIIEGNRIWIREFPKTGKVVFTLDEGALCKVLEKGEEQVIRGNQDFWYKIEHEGKLGWVFGSQSNIKQKASLNNFQPFLDYFLQKCVYENDLNNLLYSKSKMINKYIQSEIGVTRLYNPGVACVSFGFEYNSLYENNTVKTDELKYFANQLPTDGFCDKSQSANGIYYTTVDDLPTYANTDEEGNYFSEEIKIPEKYKEGQKVKVNILEDGWISKIMYFMIVDGKWWLVLIDDCDCSA